MVSSDIDHISDTAFWVATYRAQESERGNGAFRDPLARKLVGERGQKIVESMPLPLEMAFAIVLRTTAIDRLIEGAIGRGIDMVVNLGAGLDTRPYRMKLPPELQWVEADFPHLIDYKNACLAADRCVCRLERIGVDLANDLERKKLLAVLGSRARKALVITEGVVPYLTNEQASRMARDLFAVPSFEFWIQDYRKGRLHFGREKKLSKKLKGTPFRFSSPDPLAFFGDLGWQVDKNIGLMDEAERLKRPLPARFPLNLIARLIPETVKKQGNKTYSFVRFVRAP